MYQPWNKRPPVLPQIGPRDFVLRSSGETITLTLQQMGQVQETEAAELSQQLGEQYVKGDLVYQATNGKSGEPPIPFPALGGVQVQPTQMMIDQAARIYTMQVGKVEECISAEEWIAFQIVEDKRDWHEVVRLANEVAALNLPEGDEDARVPNDSGAATKISSERS